MDPVLLVVTLVAVNVRRNLLGLYYEATAHAMPRLTGECTARQNRTRPDSTNGINCYCPRTLLVV